MIYNSLPHIKVAQHTKMEKVPQILQVIRKYHLEEKIGVARLHKHFDLSENQFVVWSISPTITSSVKRQKASPVCFALKNNEWIPTEFYDGPDIWAELQQSSEFQKWIQEINEIIGNEHNTYGLILRLTKGNDMEETDEKSRSQIIEPKKSKEYKGQVVTKYWADIDAQSWCCTSNCYNYDD